MQWFVLRVASNKEEQVRDTLSRKMQVEGVKSVGRIMVPFESVKRIRGGKQRVFKVKSKATSRLQSIIDRLKGQRFDFPRKIGRFQFGDQRAVVQAAFGAHHLCDLSCE